MKYSSMHPPLICMQTNSTCFKRTSTMQIRGVLWHSTGANNPYISRYVQPGDNDPNRDQMLRILGVNRNHNDWNHIYREAGLNCWVGKLADGSISTVQTMPWDYKPWGCGGGSKGSCNNGWIQFEICEDGLTDANYFAQAYVEACEITAYLCKMFNIDPQGMVQFNGLYVPTILCHQDSYRLGLGGDHSDIYNWFPRFGKNMDNVRRDVASLCAGAPSIPVSSIASMLSFSSSGMIGTPYVPRLTIPEAGNLYYNNSKSRTPGYNPCITGKPTNAGCNVLANCVGYAVGRFNEIGGYGSCKYLGSANAENFIEKFTGGSTGLTYGPEPKLGACIVWQKGPTLGSDDGAGHVAIVEQIISPTEIVTSESGWKANSPFWTQHRNKGSGNWGAGSAYRFRGFIYNPAVDDNAYVVGDAYTSGYGRQITFADLGIDETKIVPYIAAIDPSVTSIDYDTLKDMKVSGMMFFAGQRYADGTHLATNVFRAKNLEKQVLSCQEAEMPFALYTKVMARNIKEAREELTQLYYTVSRYPPRLGLWLSLKFPVAQQKNINHSILDLYYDKLTEWGLSKGSGLYVTQEELNMIDWGLYRDKFQLWIREIAEEDEINSLDIVIEPNFFKVEYEEIESNDDYPISGI